MFSGVLFVSWTLVVVSAYPRISIKSDEAFTDDGDRCLGVVQKLLAAQAELAVTSSEEVKEALYGSSQQSNKDKIGLLIKTICNKEE